MKTKTRKVKQNGGFFGLFENSTPNYPSQSWGDWFSGLGNKAKNSTTGLLNSANNAIGNITSNTTNAFNSTTNDTLNSNVPLTTETNNATINNSSIQQTRTVGGNKKRKTNKHKGGNGKFGLTYYATPVSGIKVPEPTYWEVYANGTNQYNIKGGKKTKKMRNMKKIRQHKKI